MSRLFDNQPQWCRQKLDESKINIGSLKEHMKLIALFDPTAIYERLHEKDVINPFQRYNSISMSIIFPSIKGFCSCGCGKALVGRQTRWANDKCAAFGGNVNMIISGHSHLLTISRHIFSANCVKCNVKENMKAHELDHIHPVKFGGAGGWLSNYEFKCNPCHREKTNKDFGFKQEDKTQLKLF